MIAPGRNEPRSRRTFGLALVAVCMALVLFASMSGSTSWDDAPSSTTAAMGPVDTIPFRGFSNDTLGRLAGVAGWGNTRWACQDSIRTGAGTAYVWPVTSGASSGAGTFVAAIDSVDAHDSAANCHDIILIEGGFYSPNGAGARYDGMWNVRISGQTARGEGATFNNYSQIESRLGSGRIMEYFRIRSPGTNGGTEGIWENRLVSNTIMRHISAAWSTNNAGNHFRIGGGTDAVQLAGSTSRHHTLQMNLSFEVDSTHATHMSLGSADDTLDGTNRPRIRKVSIYQNFMSGPGRRMPRLSTDSTSVIHNIAYNFGNQASAYNDAATDGPAGAVDVIGYYGKAGPRSDDEYTVWVGTNDSTMFSIMVRDIQADSNSFAVNANPDSLVRGSNRVVGCSAVNTSASDGSNHGWCAANNDTVPLHLFRQDTLPTGPSYAEIPLTVFDSLAREEILTKAGNSRSLSCGGQWSAWGAARDSIDTRAIAEFRNNTGVNRHPYPVTERSVGEPADGADCTDTDGDKLPDDYETAQCGTTGCIPSWTEWVNGRYAGDWYLQGCNLDGTLVGDETTSCGGTALAAPAGPVDTIPFRGVANDTLGRLAGLPGWGNTRWNCQDSVRTGDGTAYVWSVTAPDGDTVGTLKAALDSANAHDSQANCHDIILIPGGFYAPNGGGTRYDSLLHVRISGQTARGEGATFNGYTSVESRGGYGRIFEYFRIRDPGGGGGIEDLWKNRSVGGQVQRHLSVSWSSVADNHLIIEGGTDVTTLPGYTSYNHTVQMNLSFEPDAAHGTHLDIGSNPSTEPRRIRRVTVIDNFFAGPNRRMPRVAQNVDTVSVIRNISYNWQNWSGEVNGHSANGPTGRVDWFGYYAKPGPASDVVTPLVIGENDSTFHRITVRDIQSSQNSYEVNADPDSLVRGSKRVVGCQIIGPDSWCNALGDSALLIFFSQDTLPTGPGAYADYTLAPFDSAARALITERAGHSRSLSCGGQWSAWGAARDSIDTRAVTEFAANTGVSSAPITSSARALGEPADGADCTDTDGDVLPDDYETAQCGTTSCIPSWGTWVNGRWAGDWYIQGCNLDGTLVGDETTSCGGTALAAGNSATFSNGRYAYIVPTTTRFGLLYYPDFAARDSIKFSVYNAARDSVLVVTCSDEGTPADSATVDARLAAWNRPTLATAAAVRALSPRAGIGC